MKIRSPVSAFRSPIRTFNLQSSTLAAMDGTRLCRLSWVHGAETGVYGALLLAGGFWQLLITRARTMGALTGSEFGQSLAVFAGTCAIAVSVWWSDLQLVTPLAAFSLGPFVGLLALRVHGAQQRDIPAQLVVARWVTQLAGLAFGFAAIAAVVVVVDEFMPRDIRRPFAFWWIVTSGVALAGWAFLRFDATLSNLRTRLDRRLLAVFACMTLVANTLACLCTVHRWHVSVPVALLFGGLALLLITLSSGDRPNRVIGGIAAVFAGFMGVFAALNITDAASIAVALGVLLAHSRLALDHFSTRRVQPQYAFATLAASMFAGAVLSVV